MSPSLAIEHHWLADDGLVPNNARVPLIVYRRAFDTSGLAGMEAAIEAHFASNDWSNAWVDGIYDFHHYHATAHEVLARTIHHSKSARSRLIRTQIIDRVDGRFVRDAV